MVAVLLALTVAAAVALGFWLGNASAELDRSYLSSLEARDRASEARISALNRELADVRLAQSVDAQAAHSLRATIGELRQELASLREEVTFYKSLMAPSSLERGLQIGEFELVAGEREGQFFYHLLLTQVEERRSWVEGQVRLVVEGTGPGEDGRSARLVLPLTDIAELDTYPLRFRFRYFQDISGSVTLPAQFTPEAITVTATPSGGGAEPVERTFDWIVRAP